MLFGCFPKEHILHILRLLLDQIHKSPAKRAALRDLQIQNLVLVGVQGKIVFRICGRIRCDDPFQINIGPGRSAAVVHGGGILRLLNCLISCSCGASRAFTGAGSQRTHNQCHYNKFSNPIFSHL